MNELNVSSGLSHRSALVARWRARLPDERRRELRAIATAQRAALRTALTKEQMEEVRRRARECRREKASSRPWSAGRIRQELAMARSSLRRAELLWSYHTRPWIVAGYKNKEEWVRATDAGREYQRRQWQVKAKGHNATRRRAIIDSGSITRSEWVAICKSWGYHCAYCGRHRTEFRNAERREDIEMDHIIPIDAPGFTHSAANIIPSCKSCNSSKSDSELLEWASATGRTIDQRVAAMYHQLRQAAGVA